MLPTALGDLEKVENMIDSVIMWTLESSNLMSSGMFRTIQYRSIQQPLRPLHTKLTFLYGDVMRKTVVKVKKRRLPSTICSRFACWEQPVRFQNATDAALQNRI